jgi:hypothetical protein
MNAKIFILLFLIALTMVNAQYYSSFDAKDYPRYGKRQYYKGLLKVDKPEHDDQREDILVPLNFQKEDRFVLRKLLNKLAKQQLNSEDLAATLNSNDELKVVALSDNK